MTDFQELDNDQRREMINTEQRFAAWSDARTKMLGFRGSLVWHNTKGHDYLTRSYYDAAGIRRQRIEGRRDSATEVVKAHWETARAQAESRLTQLRKSLDRQSAINRALRLGRVPSLGARIIRAIDAAGLLGNGLRVVGTNAIYAYEAAAGVMVDPGITTSEDINLLMDARMKLRISANASVPDGALINVLRKVDRSFSRTNQTFRAVNDQGYLVDLMECTPSNRTGERLI